MKKKFKDILYALLFGLIGSIVLSIALTLAVASVLQTPIYTLLVTLFFIPFNWSELRNACHEGRWIAAALIAIPLFVISAFIFGLIRFASGYGVSESYFAWIILFSAPLLFFSITTYRLCTILIPKNHAFILIRRQLADLARGSRILRF